MDQWIPLYSLQTNTGQNNYDKLTFHSNIMTRLFVVWIMFGVDLSLWVKANIGDISNHCSYVYVSFGIDCYAGGFRLST